MADLLPRSLGAPAFTWGSVNTRTGSATRAGSMHALRTADAGDFGALANFVRS